MSKVVVRFALRVKLQWCTDALQLEGSNVGVEWKRGKHHGVCSAAAVLNGRVAWEGQGQEFLLPCTLYYSAKKSSFEEKELTLFLVKQPGAKKVGTVRVALAALALLLADAPEKAFVRKDAIEGMPGAHLEYTATLKRLLDPRDGKAPITASNMAPPSPREGNLSPIPVASVPVVVSTTSLAKGSGGAPSVPGRIDSSSETLDGQFAPRPPTKNVSSGDLPRVPRSPRIVHTNPEEERSSPRSALPDASPATDRSSYASAGGMSFTKNVRGHNRPGSSTTAVLTEKDIGVPTVSVEGRGSSNVGGERVPPVGGTAQSPARNKKGILGHAGHRRGKSHAVTPEELKGLHAPLDLRPLASNDSSRTGSSNNISRKSGAPGGVKLFSKHAKRGSNASSPALPHSPVSLSGSTGGDAFLITGDSDDSDDGATSDVPTDVVSWLAVEPSVHSPRRSLSRASLADRDSPDSLLVSSDGGSDDAGVRRSQGAEQARRRDETFVFHTFVAFSEPAYSSELSVSAYALFRCLEHWDSFRVEEGRPFREQLLEGFEKLSKSVKDQPRAMYWLSTSVSLLFLLRMHHKPIPRSEMAKSNTLVVFQERLRGLTTAFFGRVCSLQLADLRPLLVPVILEQHSLEDLTPGPSTLKHARAVVQHRATVADILKSLDAFRAALAASRVVSSIVSQLFARLAHGMVAYTLNTLLDNNPRLCTFSNGLQMKKPVSELRAYLQRHQFEAAARELAPLDEVVNVLCMNKSVLVEADVRREVCPSLTQAQLSQLLLQYTPDEFDSEPVPPAVLKGVCGQLQQPYDFRMSEESSSVLSLDLTEASYTLAKVPLPASVLEVPSLAFLSTPTSTKGAPDDSEW